MPSVRKLSREEVEALSQSEPDHDEARSVDGTMLMNNDDGKQNDSEQSLSTIRRGVAPFRPQARLIRLLGEELISDETMAILELVKNAYDADARRVLITFHSSTQPDSGAI